MKKCDICVEILTCEEVDNQRIQTLSDWFKINHKDTILECISWTIRNILWLDSKKCIISRHHVR